MQPNRFLKFLIFILVIIFSSCEKEMLQSTNDDFYQESKREVISPNLSYKLKENVVFITPYMLENVMEIKEDSILVFNSKVDRNRLPDVDMILLSSNESTKIPKGFVGKIKDITNSAGKVELVTTAVNLNDLFTEFTCDVEANPADFDIYDESDNVIPSEIVYIDEDSDNEMISDEMYEDQSKESRCDTRASGSANYSREFKVSISTFPHLKSEGVMRIGGMVKLEVDLQNEYVNLDVIMNATAKVGVKASVGQSLGFDQTKKSIGRIMMSPIPSMPAITVPINLYTYEMYDGKVVLEATVTSRFAPSATVSYNKGIMTGKLNLKSNKKLLDGDLKLNGKLSYALGTRIYCGVGLYKWEVARMKYIYLDAHSKLEASTEVDLMDLSDSSVLFSALKNASVNLSAKGGLFIEKKGFLTIFGKRQTSATTTDIVERSANINLGNLYLLPQINSASVKTTENGATGAFSYVRNLLLPVNIGFTVYRNGEEISTHYQSGNYWFGSNRTYNFSFSGLPDGSYYMSPVYKLLGVNIYGDEKYAFTISKDSENQNLVGVDLGLSVIWGNKNLGASSPSAVGKLYGLGNTLENLMKYLNNSDYEDEYTNAWYAENAKLARYFNFPELPYEKVYYFNINGTPFAPHELTEGWRIPTLDELYELRTKTSVVKSNLNGVDGYTFTAGNGNSIFVPVTGMKNNPDLTNTLKMMGADGALESAKPGWYSYASGITIPPLKYHDAYYWNAWPGCIRPVKDK